MGEAAAGETLAEVLRRLREAAGLSQQALAERARVSVSLVSQVEQGKRAELLLSTAFKLADALGVAVDAFRAPAAKGKAKKGG
jgi:transcriptional regulator with XRE-family HTH domain